MAAYIPGGLHSNCAIPNPKEAVGLPLAWNVGIIVAACSKESSFFVTESSVFAVRLRSGFDW